MEINELSKKMYEEVPLGGTLFSIDKIGLRIATKYLNKDNLDPWKKDREVTVLTFGETAQINIHAEFEPLVEHQGRRCFNAIVFLMLNEVFNCDFMFKFCQLCSLYHPLIWFQDTIFSFFLDCFFKVIEWEWAMDFLDYPIYSSIDTNPKNKKSLSRYMNSYYSRDGKTTRRLRERNGKLVSLSKGNQQSLVCIYNRGLKIGSDRPIERVEIRQQGKNNKGLSIELLSGDKEDALKKAAPMINKLVKKVIDVDALNLNEHWENNLPNEYWLKSVFLGGLISKILRS